MTPVDGHAAEEPEDFIDPKGYWADPERNVRRKSGDKGVVLKAAQGCTEGEWKFVLDSLGIEGND